MEQLEQVLSGFSKEQIEGHKYNLPEVEQFLTKEGYMEGELALIGHLLYEKYKDKCIEMQNFSSGLLKTIKEAEELLNQLKAK